MKEITLGSRPLDVLKVNIGEDSYSIPLAGSLPYADIKGISALKDEKDRNKQLEYIVKFFERYIPAEVLATLTSGDLKTLFSAWGEASNNGDLGLGE